MQSGLLLEKSFRMSKHDLQARPACHRKPDSIEAHLSVVFAALAVSRWIEAQTGWSIQKFVRTARRYRGLEIQAGGPSITALDPPPSPSLRPPPRGPGGGPRIGAAARERAPPPPPPSLVRPGTAPAWI